ncbi:MAG: M23 family metallopeptidase [Alphaproteobacteria bacterium]|nr:M23 family metallopeptidase [Alphaproteobacteria bacterium]
MRTVAAIALALFVAGAGLATYLAGGGKVGLTMIPGLEDVALEFGWIEETTPPKASPTAAANASSPASAAVAGRALAAEPAAGAAGGEAPPEVSPAAGPGGAGGDASRLFDVPGRDAARAAGGEGAAPLFAMPVVCRPGVDCLVQSFVDAAPGDAFRDFTCGALTYDDHKGTDIRLPSHVELERGYTVVAAAPGRVIAVRDGMPDANFNLFGREAVTDRGLGNVVGIDHGGGWRTFYGHMKRGSLTVREGQQVEAGQPIGQIGLSGLTEFPHLHFQIMRDETPVDPYTGLDFEGGCGLEGESLWAPAAAQALKYPRTLLLRLGFSDMVLNKPAVEYMLFKRDGVPAANRALILHAHLTGLLEGDRAEVRIFAPDGSIFAQAGVDIDQAVQSRILRVGKRDLAAPPAPGLYRGELRYFRAGEDGPVQLFEASETVAVE